MKLSTPNSTLHADYIQYLTLRLHPLQ